jgi:tRNA1(Val) A37 N6-methylase TrmN6
MLQWAHGALTPDRVVDPGCGSGRFLVEAGRSFEAAQLIGIEVNPTAAVLAKAHLVAAGMGERSTILANDYRQVDLPTTRGRTLFIGNPPYVRHHGISAEWKRWLVQQAQALNLAASQLAGLHIYFLLATAILAKPGDVGVFITSAEWLDVNYGSLARNLLLQKLGLRTVRVIDPKLQPFPGTATTGVIVEFEVGAQPTHIAFQHINHMENLYAGEEWRSVPAVQLGSTGRWSSFTRTAVPRRRDFIELGEICRVHRGQATGANAIWIANGQTQDLPASVLVPTVTRAKELLVAGETLEDWTQLRCVIDLPPDLGGFNAGERAAIEAYLRYAEAQGADQTYIAQHRTPWWSVGLRKPAPILATYMARRPPVFVRNLAEARHINIAHGLYPRQQLDEQVLLELARFLTRSGTLEGGRMYAGGLTKFEPREMERLLIPEPSLLAQRIPFEELVK